MTVRRILLPTVALAVMMAAPSSAAERDKIDDMLDILLLWNDCRPLDLLVERLPRDAAKIGLGAEGIKVVVRNHLRHARIYDESRTSSHTYLYVQVGVNKSAASIGLKFRRGVRIPLPTVPVTTPKLPIEATTWETGWVGPHGGDKELILGVIGTFTDQFIDEYLRVNAGACKR